MIAREASEVQPAERPGDLVASSNHGSTCDQIARAADRATSAMLTAGPDPTRPTVRLLCLTPRGATYRLYRCRPRAFSKQPSLTRAKRTQIVEPFVMGFLRGEEAGWGDGERGHRRCVRCSRIGSYLVRRAICDIGRLVSW
jgi:hypothetical protein